MDPIRLESVRVTPKRRPPERECSSDPGQCRNGSATLASALFSGYYPPLLEIDTHI